MSTCNKNQNSGPIRAGQLQIARLIAGEVADDFAVEEIDAETLTPAKLAKIERDLGQMAFVSPRKMLSECKRSIFDEKIGSSRGSFIRLVDQRTTILSQTRAGQGRGTIPRHETRKTGWGFWFCPQKSVFSLTTYAAIRRYL